MKFRIILILAFALILAPAVVYGWDSGVGKWVAPLNSSSSGQNKITLTNDLPTVLGGLVKGASGLVGVIFFVITVYAGILWMTAAGSDEKIGKAKKMIIDGAIGVTIALSAFLITTLVTSKLLVSSNPNEGCCQFEDEGDCTPVAGSDMKAAQTQCEYASGTWVTK